MSNQSYDKSWLQKLWCKLFHKKYWHVQKYTDRERYGILPSRQVMRGLFPIGQYLSMRV